MNLPDALNALLRRRKFILLNVLVVAVLAAGVSLLLPQRFAATARVLPPPEDDPLGLTAQLSVGIGGQLGRLRAGMFGGGTASDLMVGILSSNTVMESVVVQCSVIQRYRVRRGSLQEAVRELGRMTGLSIGDEGIVTIVVEARRPEWAAEMANSYVSNLDAFLRSSNMSRGRNMRVFVERRLEEVAQALDSARESLTSYQVRHGLVAVDEQVKGAVTSYASLHSSLLERQAVLRVLESASSFENPLMVSARAEVSALERYLDGMLGGKDRAGVAFGLKLDTLPVVVAEYLRRYAELVLLQETHTLLYQQYEHARIMEARDTPTITVLDHAVPPERRSFPKRLLIVLIASVFSLAVGSSYVLVEERFARLPLTHPQVAESWMLVRRQLAEMASSLLRRLRRRTSRER
ncbi:MAG TPA: hypothetical protein ENN51_07355 [candidate division WOR-3 bacterium]|uniref:Polysaccharide chain length determinant N-terminal domain-containing protein n=1 Tax=candidate division WOR-3 bacterium TaxID=2052148 RepID=A0A7V0T6H6_UNCW3|nr:hypothetical protein [candidate division WOR-3 bacterium]